METPAREPVVKTGDIVEGRYRIIKILADGGMGTVFLAEHVLIKRRVAIKILHSDLAADTDVIERFMNEALAAGTLGHPNIVESTDMGFTRSDVPYIVFEYLEGTLLTDEIYRVGGLPPRRALRIAEQIASALDAAHNAGIVHRDLKSDNIFLTDREDALDHVKVLDFGISRFLEMEHDSRRGIVMGTPEFMAPEQITSPDTVDKRADIYALGVVLYEMLSARRPFSRDSAPGDGDRDTKPRAMEVSPSELEAAHSLLQHIVHDPPPPLVLSPDAPAGLAEMILEKLLAKDPERRYDSMKTVQSAFEAFHGVIRQSRPSGSIPPLSKPHMPEGTPVTPIALGSDSIPSFANVPEARAVPLPPAPSRRGPSVAWLLLALVAGVGGGGAMYTHTHMASHPGVQHEVQVLLDGDAEKIGAALDNAASAAHLRADGIATTPMLRAAIETDAATVKDMAGSDFIFAPAKGEVLELFQLKDGQPTSLLRIPAGAPAIKPLIGNATRIETDGTSIAIVASAPVAKMTSGVGGALAVSLPVDLTALKHRVAEHALSATLVGLARPVPLAAPADGVPVSVPISVNRDLKVADLALAAVVTAPPPPSNTLQLAAYTAWGIAGVLLLFYVAGLLRSRGRG